MEENGIIPEVEVTEQELRKEARRQKRLRDHSKPQMQEEKPDVTSEMSRAEFEKKFPHLPLSIWYGRHCHTGKFFDY